MPRGKIIENSTVRSIRVPDSDWKNIQDESKKKKKAVAQIIRDRLSGVEKPSTQECELPLAMFAPCGEPQSMESLTQPFGEDAKITVRGPLTALVTEHSFVAIAQGSSMECSKLESISNGDRLLMIPKADWKQDVSPGALVLTKITYLNSGEPRITLKKYADIGKLKANNPKHKAPVADETVESFEALAVCAGVLEKTFI